MKIQTVGWRGDRAVCGYCLDSFVELVSLCVGCGVAIHAECRAELGHCPTLGCAEGRSEPERRAFAGRNTRAAPGWRVRVGPYSRIYAWPLTFASLGVLTIFMTLVTSADHPVFGRSFEAGAVFAASLLLFVLFWLTVATLSKARAQHRRVVAALDDGAVRPFRLLATEAEGSLALLLQPAGEGVEQVVLNGVTPPAWLVRRYGEKVYLHGQPETGGAGVLEFEDGRLALLEE